MGYTLGQAAKAVGMSKTSVHDCRSTLSYLTQSPGSRSPRRACSMIFFATTSVRGSVRSANRGSGYFIGRLHPRLAARA